MDLMKAEEKSIKLRACQRVSDFTLRAKEMDELIERLARVKKLVSERKGYR